MINEDDVNQDVTVPENVEQPNTSQRKVSYSEEDYQRLSSGTNPALLPMYEELDKYLLSLGDDVQKNSTKHYIGYTNGKSFVEFHFWSNNLFLTIMSGEYDDPMHKIVKLDDNYKWSNMNRLDIYENDDLDYIKGLLKQSYEKTKR